MDGSSQGDAAVASRNNVIGQFNLTGLPPGPKGGSRVEITFQVDVNNVLSAVATDLDANRQEQWLRQGSMTAQAHATDIITVQ
ncbi:Chaperone protein DnaK [Tetrabaena socialis]|uniref:Chaperone protein DnaK n=1 Tax=Tetrabaena socialis TaxID=47790 RepID=A0A2J8AFV5_9CHLO|nr:Chaperone protein DnaK [Tetrabaena socialis]|eukprot:PNH11403.1 Chaperone protein DnaK [Tetrabaena socialis]